ncbi:MAG: hypothetical protein BAA02_06210 [Paenibacillaceae bacterium ZCTH02-B3]|nr:MAG: hypothetical protein BAA02_06210 [Paenibacillaceae bacterium ZCTH02-B3]
MNVDVPGYIVFGAIEAAGIFAIMFYVFRFDAKLYYKEIAVASILFPFLTYMIRVEMELHPIVYPFVSVLYFTFFTYSILRAPAVWSLIISSLANIVLVVAQSILLVILTAADVISFERVTSYQRDAFALQLITAVILTLIGHRIYTRGYGFSFPFHVFRWKGENRWMMAIILVWFAVMAILFVSQNVAYGLVIAIVILFLLLYFAVRKERSEI